MAYSENRKSHKITISKQGKSKRTSETAGKGYGTLQGSHNIPSKSCFNVFVRQTVVPDCDPGRDDS